MVIGGVVVIGGSMVRAGGVLVARGVVVCICGAVATDGVGLGSPELLAPLKISMRSNALPPIAAMLNTTDRMLFRAISRADSCREQA